MGRTLVNYWGSHVKRPIVVAGLARALAATTEAGWRTVIVMSRPPEDPSWLEPVAKHGEIVFLPRPQGQFDAGCIRRAYQLCRRVKADVFRCDNMHTSPMIGAALAGVPVRLWTKRAMDPSFEQMRAPTLRERLALSVRTTAALATRVIAVSGGVKQGLVDLGVPPSKVVVVHNPRDTVGTRLVPRDEARAQLGYGKDDLVVATIGHSVPVKGWDVLVDAFARVSASLAHARLLLVGSTSSADEAPTHSALARAIQEQGLADRVRFTGYMLNPAWALSAADIYALPSRSEGYGVALLEALEAGLPCISTRVGIAEDFIADRENGWLVPRNDPDALAEAILTLGRDPAMRARFAAAAASRIDAPRGAEYWHRMMALYESLLNNSA